MQALICAYLPCYESRKKVQTKYKLNMSHNTSIKELLKVMASELR